MGLIKIFYYHGMDPLNEQSNLDDENGKAFFYSGLVDLSYYIKNLDTGEQIDSRNEDHLETMLG